MGGILFSVVLTCYPTKLMHGAYVINIGLIASMGFFVYADSQASRELLLTANGCVGFFLLPVIFVAYELAVE